MRTKISSDPYIYLPVRVRRIDEGLPPPYGQAVEEAMRMDKNAIVIPKGMEHYYDQFHFAPAVKDGNRLYCSGVIGVGSDGKLSADPETQFTQAFESLKSVLTAAGVSFAEVIDMTTFHVGLHEHLTTFMKVKD